MRTTHRWLDEAGHVYVAEGGSEGQCVRLNSAASRVWRELLTAKRTLDELTGGDRKFALTMLDRGVLLENRTD